MNKGFCRCHDRDIIPVTVPLDEVLKSPNAVGLHHLNPYATLAARQEADTSAAVQELEAIGPRILEISMHAGCAEGDMLRARSPVQP